MKKLFLSVIFSFLLVIGQGKAQIRLSSIDVDEWVKKNFSGQGVVIGNVAHRGYPLAILSFTSTANVLGVPRGLVLSSGNSFNVAGYNNSHNQSSTFRNDAAPENDEDLSKLIREKLYDICSIEFDFVPLDNSIQFNYQFGSDEYPEYVDSPYNDIFAFIVSDEEGSQNIALVPGTNVPVSINTVNFKLNQEHFIDNNLYRQIEVKRQPPVKYTSYGTFPGRVLRGIASIFTSSDTGSGSRTVIAADPELLKTLDANLYRNLRYDGITKKLVAQTYVTPYKKYHLKIVIADVSDNIYDSGVFIEDRSLTAKKDVLEPGFRDYPDLSQVIDANLILQGKTLEEIIPDEYKGMISSVSLPSLSAPEVVSSPAPATTGRPGSPVLAVPVLQSAVIHFDFDRSDIKPAELTKLQEALRNFEALRDHYTFRITGHTDSIGSMAYNVQLSKRRNESVIRAVQEILGKGFALPAEPKSFTEPVADNGSDEGRQANRRVEIIFTRKP